MWFTAGSIDREYQLVFSFSRGLACTADLQTLEGRVGSSSFPKVQKVLRWFLFLKKLLAKLQSYPCNQLNFFFEIVAKEERLN